MSDRSTRSRTREEVGRTLVSGEFRGLAAAASLSPEELAAASALVGMQRVSLAGHVKPAHTKRAYAEAAGAPVAAADAADADAAGAPVAAAAAATAVPGAGAGGDDAGALSLVERVDRFRVHVGVDAQTFFRFDSQQHLGVRMRRVVSLPAPMPASVGWLVELHTLQFMNVPLSSVAREIGLLTNLTSLSIMNDPARRGTIAELPASIGDLANLESLTVSGHVLTTLPARIGELARLRNLDVSLNKIASLPSSLSTLRELVDVNLSLNHLTTVPSLLASRELLFLHVRHNRLASVPAWMQAHPRARFYLDANPVTVVKPASIGALVRRDDDGYSRA